MAAAISDDHHLPRVTQLETEYVRAVTAAELRWVAAVVDELADGSLAWTDASFAGLTSSD